MEKMAEKDAVPSSIPISRQKITIWHLQKMKDEGKRISMVGTANCDPFWVMACERAGVNLIRYTAPGETTEQREQNLYVQTRLIRKMAPNICLNAMMQSRSHADKYTAVKVATSLLSDGADSVNAMGITLDTLKYMSDNCIPVFGHTGCLSGWQTGRYGGYRRIGKTAEDAMEVFRQAYDYQENGMVGMTIEMTPREVTKAIAKKLRVPIIEIAAGDAADDLSWLSTTSSVFSLFLRCRSMQNIIVSILMMQSKPLENSTPMSRMELIPPRNTVGAWMKRNVKNSWT
jgi:3-methyl-2-oxobutanoate hydroxymethyltransferase